MPVAPPPPRTRDGESDAFGRAASDEDPAVARAAFVPTCPPGSRWEEGTRECVIREVRCPRGSRKVGSSCIGEVTCPDGSTWDGSRCQPLTPIASSGPSPSSCTLQLNSIPQTEVLLDGRPLGPTPRQRVQVAPGTHTVMFVGEDAKKVVSVSCKAGEVRSVAVKMRD
jgi:hypothetical protein